MDVESQRRYQQWLNWYFPDPSFTTDEVKDFIEKNSPHLPRENKKEMIRDWEEYIAEQEIEPELEKIREGIGAKSPSFWQRLRAFLGRLFR